MNDNDYHADPDLLRPWRDVRANVRTITTAPPSSITRMPDTNTWADRHPSVSHFAPLFQYEHLPPHLQMVSKVFADAAHQILTICPTDGPELTVTLRKLWEAKNSAVVHNGFCQDPK